MSNSKAKMDVVVTDAPWGKKWAKVTMKNSRTFYPSFEDLHRIIQAICYCEDLKYPGGMGRDFVADFLWDCVYCTEFNKLAEKYGIPIRQGGDIVNRNEITLNQYLGDKR